MHTGLGSAAFAQRVHIVYTSLEHTDSDAEIADNTRCRVLTLEIVACRSIDVSLIAQRRR